MKRSSFLTVLAAAVLVVCLALTPRGITAQAAETGTPFAEHGTLSVSGSVLTDASGNTFQLRGVTVHGISSAASLTDASLQILRDSWGMNTLRVRPTDEERDAVTAGDGSDASLYSLLQQTAALCSSTGMYLIVDWYTDDTWDAAAESTAAYSYFSNAAEAVSGYSGVLFEICGSGLPSWNDMREFAPGVIDAIRAVSPQAVVIAGIPGSIEAADLSLSQPVDRSNVLYAVSVDASSEQESSIDKLTQAASGGMALFVSSFTPEDNPGADTASARWIDFFNQNSIGFMAGYLFSSTTDTGLLKETAPTEGWTDSDLTDQASWLLQYVGSGSADTAGFTASAESAQQLVFDLGTCSVTVTETFGSYYGQPSCQYDFIITNVSSSDLNGWRLKADWQNSDLALYDYWNCEAGASGSSVILVSSDFNAYIAAGSSQSFGIIVTSSASPQLISVGFDSAG